MRLPISAIILAKNEERNIRECLESIYGQIDEIFIVDSYSSDKTVEIAKQYTDNIFQHKFDCYAKQFDWALKNIPFSNPWIIRLDADERWPAEALEELKGIISEGDIEGVYVKMKIYFMDKWIRFGGFYPNYFLRVFRMNEAIIEKRYMDEHIAVGGKTKVLNNDIIEYNEKDRNFSIANFIIKHNSYSNREAIEEVIMRSGLGRFDTIADFSGNKTERKRWVKEKIYLKLPLFARAIIYFVYRYFFQLGFLDGKRGLIFHFLQGLCYRFIVDAKIYEIERRANGDKSKIKEAIKKIYNIDIDSFF